MSQPLFKKVAFIGLGLIGSSLARVIVAEKLATTIVASTRSQKTLEDAKSLGLIQEGFSDPVEAVKGADLVVLSRRHSKQIFDLILKFADYGFPRAHAVSYSKIAYIMSF